jgi:hypothetical protein
MEMKEKLMIAFNMEFPHANIVGLLEGSNFFCGVIDAKEVRQLGLNFFQTKMLKVNFVFDIEEDKFFFTEM